MKNRNGISLIVLVITIIIIIIIAGSVILSLANNNPIGQATEASFKESVKAYSSEVEMYLASQYAITLGAYNPELLEADSTHAAYNGSPISGMSNMYSIVKSLDPTSADGNKFAIRKGKLIYTGTDSKLADWVEQAYLENLYIPKLNVTANPAGNKINLNWTINDTAQPYTYKIYQQKEGDLNFQSISTSNLKANVKVLNVYPPVASTITYTTYNGDNRTISASAALEMWMEQTNVENTKGYGMGLIDVDPVSFVDFNANPNLYLKDAQGKWKYDSIFIGSWDSNGTVGDMSASTADAIKTFISNGRGVLFGHDTIHYSKPNFASIRSYANIKVPGNSFDYPSTTVPWIASDKISIKKKGLLTNYPWNIGDEGTVLTIPYAHSTAQVAYGDVWMEFYEPNGVHNQGPAFHDPVTGLGTSNFYLTTWNNTAMIQTGHSSGAATTDEQKVIANTLFYLSQLTSDTFLDDNSGQDVKAPTVPVITAATINGGTGKVDITFTASIDQGSTYSYYVEAIGQNNAVITKTGTRTATITSGIAGYSVVVDTNPSTIPASTVNTTTLTTSITKPVGTDIYVHIKAIDNKGNVSNTVHLKAS